MKAISLWQPWATLIVIGAKQYETRSWKPYPAMIGRRIAIHAAKKKDLDSLGLCLTEPFRTCLVEAGLTIVGDLPFGAVLGTAVITRAEKTHEIRDVISEQERAFGDYSYGRFAWRLDQIEKFDEPIPVNGAQGFWDWDGKAQPVVQKPAKPVRAELPSLFA